VIIEAIVTVFALFVRAVVALFLALTPPVPGFVSTAFGYAGQCFAVLDSFSTWLPVAFGFQVAAAVIATYLVAGAIQLIRMVISYFTAGGGVT